MIRFRSVNVRSYSSLRKLATSSLVAVDSAKCFQQSLSDNSTLAKLAKAYKTGKFGVAASNTEMFDDLNSDRSLPLVRFPKLQVFEEVQNDPKVGDWRKPATKWFRLGKKLLKMYLNGIKDTWRVFYDSRKVLQKIGNSQSIITLTYRDLEFQEIQNRIKPGSPVRLAITRRELQEIYRRQELWKLPAFFVLLLIFEETLPVICFLVPSLVPWNCLTPGAYKKLSERRIVSQSLLPFYQLPTSSPSYTPPYALELSHTTDLLKRFKMLSKTKAYLYSWSENRTRLGELLAQFHQYLVLDDWLLLQSILNTDQKTILSEKELVNAILDRQLYRPGEDLNYLTSNEIGRKMLIWRLIVYWSFRFQGTAVTGGSKTFSELWGVNNIGVLNCPGTQQLIDESILSVIEG
ncbi:LAME_0H02696g1_1 [Lachancea meyersii CBS 8951]|uniref:LAME_0H02696g1_1 n=1 Tax=Lachancea meyersii CBS 8951 TaxID=1266667 RepID=A0A1G4KDG5_9SACH|nr:LAME_0H02696g1_1 [Lachancea meyersii CBS 8951]